MYSTRVLGLSEAMTALQAMLEEAYKERERPVAIAIVDQRGDLVCYGRMDRAPLLPQRIAIRKAYTAAVMGVPSKTWGDNMKSRGVSTAELGDPMLIAIQGGLPVLTKDGFCIGGIGVSGRKPEEDEDISKTGIKAVNV